MQEKIKKYIVIRSPHIYKKSREQFETRTFKRLISFNASPQYFHLLQAYLTKFYPVGLAVKILSYQSS